MRPILEYGSVIWSPKLKQDEERIEKIQRRATKLVPEIKDLSYTERLEKLDLASLHYRRFRADVWETYKIIHNDKTELKNKIFTLNTNTNTRGHQYKLAKPHTRTKTRQNFLIQALF